MTDEKTPEKIVLPRSGLKVSIRKVMGGWEVTLLEYDGSEHRYLCAKRDRTDAIAASDTRVLALRSALLVGAEETVAQAMWTHDEWNPKTLAEADESNIAKVRAGAASYRAVARAVIAALCGEGGK